MSKIKKTIIFLMVSIIGVIFLLNISVHNNYIFAYQMNKAIENNDYQKAERLIKSSNADIDSVPYTNFIILAVTERSVYSPLETAIIHGNIEILRLLIQHGANVNRQKDPNFGRDFQSPLTLAALSTSANRLEMIKLLVEYGADINFEVYGSNAMAKSVMREANDNIEIIEFFESLGVPLERKYSDGSLLHIACYEGNSAVIRYLVKRGLDVNEKNSYGSSALISLMYSRETRIEDLIFLIENGADKSIVNNEGLTAYDIAIEYEELDFAEILKP